MSRDVEDGWLDLLRRLCEQVPELLVWRDLEPALHGPEDVDAAAPRACWPELERAFRAWAAEHDRPVVVCRHVPATLELVSVHADGRTLLQLEVVEHVTLRGGVLVRAEQLLPLTVPRPGGVRQLRPGSEAALRLVLHGLRKGGRPDRGQLARHDVAAFLRADPDGVRGVAAGLGRAGPALLRAATAWAEGRWHRPAVLAVEVRMALLGLRRPRAALAKTWFRRVERGRCPVLRTAYGQGRRIVGDPGTWWRTAQQAHPTPTGRGRFVVLVGPDGVGKTTVASALLDAWTGPRGYVYFRPALSGPLATEPPPPTGARGNKNPPAEPRPLGWLRLLKSLLLFWGGYLRTLRPVLRAGGLVVADRWGYAYAVQPGAVRFFGPDALGRLGVRLLPRPHLVASLAAPPALVVQRKDELTTQEVERELGLWQRLPVPNVETFDATGRPEAIAADVLRRLEAM